MNLHKLLIDAHLLRWLDFTPKFLNVENLEVDVVKSRYIEFYLKKQPQHFLCLYEEGTFTTGNPQKIYNNQTPTLQNILTCFKALYNEPPSNASTSKSLPPLTKVP